MTRWPDEIIFCEDGRSLIVYHFDGELRSPFRTRVGYRTCSEPPERWRAHWTPTYSYLQSLIRFGHREYTMRFRYYTQSNVWDKTGYREGEIKAGPSRPRAEELEI